MNPRAIIFNVFGMSCGVCALVGVLSLVGCNSEPTGDAAYSQKFEAPPEAADATKKPVAPPITRAEEREEDQANALKRQSRKKR